MDINSDVLKELEAKNKEIYLNKLNIDVDTNLENMLMTINNIMELLQEELLAKIKEITNNNNSNKDVVTFQKLIHEKLIDLINKRAEALKNSLVNIDNIDYKDTLSNETNALFEKFEKIYKENINSLIEKLSFDLDNFQKERLNEYLNTLFYEKLKNKIKETISNLDIILYNNYQESYQKYLSLGKNNQKTLK